MTGFAGAGILWAATALVPPGLVAVVMLGSLVPGRGGAATRAVTLRAAPLAAAPAVALAFLAPGPAHVDWLLLGTHLAVDEPARLLLVAAAILYGAALAATCWNHRPPSAMLTSFLLMSFSGNIGTYLAADVVTFYLSFAVMSFSAFALVIHYRTRAARRAARIYIVLSVASETAVLAALILVAASGARMIEGSPAVVAGSEHRDLIITLVLVGFGVKAGTVPLHVWLPLAHPAAPPAASAVLSGAMVKAGMIGMVRFLPLGEAALPQWGTVLIVLSLAGAFLAVPLGVLQADPKVVLAYSTISQMGFITTVIGAGLAVPDLARPAVLAVTVYAVCHGLVKATLFLGVAVWQHHRGVLAAVLLAAAAAALAGAPLTAGALGKYAAKDGVAGLTFIGAPLDVVLTLVATGSTLLMLRLGRLLWRSEPDPSPDRGELGAWITLALAAATVPWAVTLAWVPQVATPSVDPLTWGDSVWPLGLGVLVGVGAWWLADQAVLPEWAGHPDGEAIPPGDLVVPEEDQLARLGRALGAGQAHLHRLTGALGSEVAAMSGAVSAFVVHRTVAREERLTAERASGVALLVVLSIVLILVALLQEGLS